MLPSYSDDVVKSVQPAVVGFEGKKFHAFAFCGVWWLHLGDADWGRPVSPC